MSAACSVRLSCIAAREDFAAGKIGAEHLRAVEDAAIAAAVTMQADAGLSVSDRR